MKAINIDDFSGGRNSYDDQLLIAPNQCASGSYNVWAPFKPLTKAPGHAVFATFTATAIKGTHVYTDETANASYKLYWRLQSSSSSKYYPWAGETDSLTPLGYTTGTVSVSGASLISATGSGTSWSTHVTANDMFRVDSSAASWYLVSSVENDTHLTLGTALPVSVATGAAYTCMPNFDSGAPSLASINGSIWMVCSADWMQRYSGAGMTRIPAGPRANFLSNHKNYLFAARTSTAESRIYWSAIKDPTSWPVSNFIDVDKDNGKVTGIHSYGNELIIFKTRGIFKLVGEVFDTSNPSFAVYPISAPKDFMFNSNDAVAVYKGELLFYSMQKLWSYRHGTFQITDISSRVFNDLGNAFGSLATLHTTDHKTYAASVNNNFLLKGFGRTSEPYVAILLDQNGAFWKFYDTESTNSDADFNAPTPMAVLSQTLKPKLITLNQGGTNGVRAISWDFIGPSFASVFIDHDDGSNNVLDGRWVSKEFNIGYGVFKWLTIYFEKQAAGNLTVEWSIDQGAFVSNTVDMTVGRGNLVRKVLDVNQKGSTIQLRISNATISQTFKVFGINIIYDEIPLDRHV